MLSAHQAKYLHYVAKQKGKATIERFAQQFAEDGGRDLLDNLEAYIGRNDDARLILTDMGKRELDAFNASGVA